MNATGSSPSKFDERSTKIPWWRRLFGWRRRLRIPAGYAANVKARLRRHETGRGSSLLWAVHQKGIPVLWVRFWKGADRSFERKLHAGKNLKRYCPICSPETWGRNGKGGTLGDTRSVKAGQEALPF